MTQKKTFNPLELTDADKRLVAGLPEHMRAEATASLLKAKVDRQTIVHTNRTQFGVSLNEKGTIVIRGINNRFPLGLRWDSLEVILNNAEVLRKLVNECKAKSPRSITPAPVAEMSVAQLEALLAAKKAAN